VVICDTDTPYWLTRSWWLPINIASDDFNHAPVLAHKKVTDE